MEQIGGGDTQGAGDAFEGVEGGIADAVFDSGYGGFVEPLPVVAFDAIAEVLKTDVLGLAKGFDG